MRAGLGGQSRDFAIFASAMTRLMYAVHGFNIKPTQRWCSGLFMLDRQYGQGSDECEHDASMMRIITRLSPNFVGLYQTDIEEMRLDKRYGVYRERYLMHGVWHEDWLDATMNRRFTHRNMVSGMYYNWFKAMDIILRRFREVNPRIQDTRLFLIGVDQETDYRTAPGHVYDDVYAPA